MTGIGSLSSLIPVELAEPGLNREAAMVFFARSIINKDVAVACGEAGFSEAMAFHRNKAAWLLAQALGCLAESGTVNHGFDLRCAQSAHQKKERNF